ncbi:MAG: AlpA family phage regulatory protein [Limimaricola sp.]|uniref:helix-turn-helix transcriptional regulator n=1 Tax=Limimaricola sp. TaxID=2211665 RepID=UPI001D7629D5|nr:AlpA family phage regulatory protein [Limimaricola sp.]MBI1417971.1 AlpA family phage regulatory protein [Limimaricola sp.]
MQERIYRRTDVEKLVGLSRSTLYAMMAEGAFPRPVKLGKRAVGWRERDVRAWLETRTTNAG